MDEIIKQLWQVYHKISSQLIQLLCQDNEDNIDQYDQLDQVLTHLDQALRILQAIAPKEDKCAGET